MSDPLTNLQNSVIRYINKERKRREKIMSDIKTSIVRTAVPYIVGTLVALLASLGITLDADMSASVTQLITLAVSLVYYIGVRLLEKKYPKAGLLLGSAKQPEYKG